MTAEAQTQSSIAITHNPSQRWGDLPAAALLLVVVFTAAARLDETNWAPNLSIVPFLGMLGVIAGMALGQSRFNKRIVVLFAIVYGAYLIIWQLGTVIEGNLPWSIRIELINSRLVTIILQLIDRARVRDSLLFVLAMAITFWTLGLHAGYILTRHGNAWWAILPLGLTVFVIHAYDPVISRRALYLAVFLFFSLVLVARNVYLHRKASWLTSRTALPPHLGLDFIRYALMIVTILVVFAWSIPGLASSVPVVVEATRPLRQSWNNLRARWENAFASLRSSVGIYTEFYGNNLALGRGNVLSDAPMFYVSNPGELPAGARFYWRSVVYDSYQAGVWSDTIFQFLDFSPSAEPPIPALGAGRWETTVEIVPLNYVSTLYTPSQPFWVSHNASIKAIANPDGTLDISGFRANPAARPQEAYQVQSSISTPTIKQLREAGTEYPTWVTERYLGLPATITPRTRQLAERITAGLETPYEKAAAITNYLRSAIEYQETVPAVPSGKEPIDWFLFDFKKGFCNYYATAEVILLRSLNIPARWAVGYAQGERQEDGSYIVRQKQAHSWPEVYFPSLGWVEFEPTASQPEIVRLAGEPVSNSDQTGGEDTESILNRQRDQLEQDRQNLANQDSPSAGRSWLFWAIALVVALVIIAAGFVLYRLRARFNFPSIPVFVETTIRRLGFQPPSVIQAWSRRAALPPLSKSYQEINRALIRLKTHPATNLTPAERADLLGTVIPSAREPGLRLVAEYHTALFSNRQADLSVARKAGAEIRRLSFQAYFHNFARSLRRTSKRPPPPPFMRGNSPHANKNKL